MSSTDDNNKSVAFQFILLMGVVSLFGDITYEGARSITGPYMAMLGATAGIVGLVAGIGEFSGYALRLLSGYFADRTKAYWPLTIAGYGLILAIPLMALADNWQVAAVLVILRADGQGNPLTCPRCDTVPCNQAGGKGLGLRHS